MSNIPITTGTGSASVASDLVGSINYQQIKLVDGTIGGSTPLKINADGSITASIYGNITTSSTPNQSVSGTVGASIVGNVNITITSVATVGGVLPVAFTTTTSPGADSVNIAAIESTSGGSGTFPLPTGTFVYNGSNWDRARGNSSIGALVTPYSFPTALISGVTSVITGTSSVQVLAPAATAQRNYITNILVTNAAAVGTSVQLLDGGNVIYAGFAAASGGGFAVSFPAPLRQSSIAGNLSALSTVQASVFVSASGYTAA